MLYYYYRIELPQPFEQQVDFMQFIFDLRAQYNKIKPQVLIQSVKWAQKLDVIVGVAPLVLDFRKTTLDLYPDEFLMRVLNYLDKHGITPKVKCFFELTEENTGDWY